MIILNQQLFSRNRNKYNILEVDSIDSEISESKKSKSFGESSLTIQEQEVLDTNNKKMLDALNISSSGSSSEFDSEVHFQETFDFQDEEISTKPIKKVKIVMKEIAYKTPPLKIIPKPDNIMLLQKKNTKNEAENSLKSPKIQNMAKYMQRRIVKDNYPDQKNHIRLNERALNIGYKSPDNRHVYKTPVQPLKNYSDSESIK